LAISQLARRPLRRVDARILAAGEHCYDPSAFASGRVILSR